MSIFFAIQNKYCLIIYQLEEKKYGNEELEEK